MAKYTEEVKAKCVEAAKNGMALAEIQRTIGPNPKATQRYLVKAGVDYKELRAKLKEAGKLKEATKPNPAKGKAPKVSKQPTKEKTITE